MTTNEIDSAPQSVETADIINTELSVECLEADMDPVTRVRLQKQHAADKLADVSKQTQTYCQPPVATDPARVDQQTGEKTAILLNKLNQPVQTRESQDPGNSHEHKNYSFEEVRASIWKALARIKQEFTEFRSDPLQYARLGIDQTRIKICCYALKVCDNFLQLKSALYHSMRGFADQVIKLLSSAADASEDNQSERQSGSQATAAGFSFKKLFVDLVEFTTSPFNLVLFYGRSASKEDGYEEENDKRRKSATQVLLDAVKQIFQALLAKKEEQHEQDQVEDAAERQERLNKQALESVREAVARRPDLACKISLPQTAAIFPSAFGETADIDSLIDEAARRKAAESIF